MKETIMICENEVQVKEWDGKRVAACDDIDPIHELLNSKNRANTINAMYVFSINELEDLKNIEKNTPHLFGYFYVLEYGCDLKIGCTRRPYSRIREFITNIRYDNITLGRFAISTPHINYRKNERMLHLVFSDTRRVGTELFHIDFDSCLCIIDHTEITYDCTAPDERITEEVGKGISHYFHDPYEETWKEFFDVLNELLYQINRFSDEYKKIEEIVNSINKWKSE